MGEKEDDGNPYFWLDDMKEKMDTLEIQALSFKAGRCEAWEEGRQYEQLHPSPQTIKKIQTNFAEKVKEAILNSLSESRYICFNHRVKWERSEVRAEVINIIDNLLKECAED